jgi:acyl carrier protein
MNREEVSGIVSDIIKEQLGVTDVSPDARLKEDLGADSLDQVEMVMHAEEKFDIEVADEDLTNINTVNDFIDFVCKKTEGK